MNGFLARMQGGDCIMAASVAAPRRTLTAPTCGKSLVKDGQGFNQLVLQLLDLNLRWCRHCTKNANRTQGHCNGSSTGENNDINRPASSGDASASPPARLLVHMSADRRCRLDDNDMR